MYAIFDISRAEKELGYKPQFTLETAIADYLESLKRMQHAKGAAAVGFPTEPAQGCGFPQFLRD